MHPEGMAHTLTYCILSDARYLAYVDKLVLLLHNLYICVRRKQQITFGFPVVPEV